MLTGEGAAEGLGVRLVAGGTDLWPNLKRRSQKASTVVSLGAVDGLRDVHCGNGDGTRIGGMVTLAHLGRHADLERRYPALSSAARGISTPALRNMGTIGGNLCLDTRCNYYNQSEEWRRSVDYCM